MPRTFLGLLIALALIWAGPQVRAQPAPVAASARVLIVSSDNSPAYAQSAQALMASLARAGVSSAEVAQYVAGEFVLRLKDDKPPAPQIFVALGSLALQTLLDSKVNAPVLSALIPSSSFERILRSSGRTASSELMAINLDQPLRRQLALIALALPQVKRVGVLLGPDSVSVLPPLRSLATAKGLILQHVAITSTDGLYGNLRHVLDGSDVFLALPDPLVFNASTIQNILLTSFRSQIPMLAFSPAYVRAGAVLALYTSPSQVGQQVAEYVLDVLRGKALPARSVAPDDFDVGVNPQVARSLGLSLDGEALRLALRRLENLP